MNIFTFIYILYVMKTVGLFEVKLLVFHCCFVAMIIIIIIIIVVINMVN